MRLLSFILAVVVLVLSCLPCSDTSLCIAAGQSSDVSISAPCEQHQPTHHDDCCSPFCQCSCCAGISMPVTLQVQEPASPQPVYITRQFIDYKQSVTPEVFLPIWQPPQLV